MAISFLLGIGAESMLNELIPGPWTLVLRFSPAAAMIILLVGYNHYRDAYKRLWQTLE